MTRPSSTGRQRGAALIMALLVVAFAATLAASMLSRQDLWVRQIEAQRDLGQARWITTAAIDWARAVLAYDARTSSFDHTAEPWATNVPPTKVEEGEVAGSVSDESAKWNLNNMLRDGQISPSEMAVFARLLSALQMPSSLAAALADWLDPDSESSPGGAEDEYYLSLSPPYRTAAQRLADVDDLLRVRGFDADTVERLRPYVTALPRQNAVNLNTASVSVLAALLPKLSLTQVRRFVEQRDRTPLRNVGDLGLYIPGAELPAEAAAIDTRSTYFRVRVHARYRRAGTVTEALLERQPNDWPRIIWQKYQ
ncbi:MAG: type II secretion system minor pseudopilin GspK [Burkholderiales bacterium]